MSYVPAVFNETQLLQQRHLADELLLDSRIKLQYQAETAAYDYIRSLQTAKVNSAFNTRKKEFDVEVMWMNACDDFTLADTSCAIGGEELSTNTQTYTLSRRQVRGFDVNDAEFRDNEYEANMAVAKGLLRIDKLHAEQFTQYLVAFLNASAGVNVVPDRAGIATDAVNTVTNIDAALWTPAIMAYMSRVMIMNRFPNAAMITGSNLYETLYTAAANAANANDKGDYILWGKMPIWFDLFNIDTVNDPDFLTYLVSQNALAVAGKTWNPDRPATSLDGRVMYTQPSRFLPGLKYDVFYTNGCDDNAANNANYRSDALFHKYKVVLTAQAFLNPMGCDENNLGNADATNTGILRFANV